MKKKITIKEFMEKLNTKINDLTIKTLHFNFIQVNTYILFDETKEAVIIDPGNYVMEEDLTLLEAIERLGVKVKFIINTHPHIDHIFGNNFCRNAFGVPLLAHEAGMPVYHNAVSYCSSFNIQTPSFPDPTQYIGEGDEITYGNQKLQVLYTPGHCDGSVCLYDSKNNIVFTGDVLFENSVGRTDLTTGNTELLMKSIKEKLLVLKDETVVFSGHGDHTTIGREKTENPYL